jgi:hypothetical protein
MFSTDKEALEFLSVAEAALPSEGPRYEESTEG